MRVGIVGAGAIGLVHANTLRELGIQELEVSDLDPQVAQRFAAQTGALVVSGGIPKMTSDAVFICTPNRTHPNLVVEALGYGKHVYCEKPLAVDSQSARDVVKKVAACNLVFQVGFNRRFSPVYKKAKERATFVSCAQFTHNRGELTNPPWVGNPAVTGGFLFETAIHMLDLAVWLFGCGVDSVQSQEHKGAIVSLLKFYSGAVATFTSVPFATWMAPTEQVFLHGHRSIRTQDLDQVSICETPRGLVETLDTSALPYNVKWGYKQAVDAFLKAVHYGEQVTVTAQDGYEATLLAERIYGSLANVR